MFRKGKNALDYAYENLNNMRFKRRETMRLRYRKYQDLCEKYLNIKNGIDKITNTLDQYNKIVEFINKCDEYNNNLIFCSFSNEMINYLKEKIQIINNLNTNEITPLQDDINEFVVRKPEITAYFYRDESELDLEVLSKNINDLKNLLECIYNKKRSLDDVINLCNLELIFFKNHGAFSTIVCNNNSGNNPVIHVLDTNYNFCCISGNVIYLFNDNNFETYVEFFNNLNLFQINNRVFFKTIPMVNYQTSQNNTLPQLFYGNDIMICPFYILTLQY